MKIHGTLIENVAQIHKIGKKSSNSCLYLVLYYTNYLILVCNNFHFDILTQTLRSLFTCMIRVIFTPQYGHTKINGDVLFFCDLDTICRDERE